MRWKPIKLKIYEKTGHWDPIKYTISKVKRPLGGSLQICKPKERNIARLSSQPTQELVSQ